MGQVPLVKSTPWADPGAWSRALRPQANTPPRVPPEGAVTARPPHAHGALHSPFSRGR